MKMKFGRLLRYFAAISFGLVAFTLTMKAQIVISNESLATSTFVVNKASKTAQCSKPGCIATASMFGPIQVTCPAAIGSTCTLYISLDAKASQSENSGGPGVTGTGFFRFLVDGAAPSIGPTDTDGSYIFAQDVTEYFRFPTRQSYSASVVAGVTNSSSQNHAIVVDIGCRTGINTGCKATAFWSTMRVDVFEP
jgi:hypothetical protein